MPWRVIHTAHNGAVYSDFAPENLQGTLNRNDVGEVSYELSLSDLQSRAQSMGGQPIDFARPYVHDWHLFNGDVLVAEGIVTSAEVNEEGGCVQVQAMTYEHYLDKRHWPMNDVSQQGDSDLYPAGIQYYVTNQNVGVVVQQLAETIVNSPAMSTITDYSDFYSYSLIYKTNIDSVTDEMDADVLINYSIDYGDTTSFLERFKTLADQEFKKGSFEFAFIRQDDDDLPTTDGSGKLTFRLWNSGRGDPGSPVWEIGSDRLNIHRKTYYLEDSLNLVEELGGSDTTANASIASTYGDVAVQDFATASFDEDLHIPAGKWSMVFPVWRDTADGDISSMGFSVIVEAFDHLGATFYSGTFYGPILDATSYSTLDENNELNGSSTEPVPYGFIFEVPELTIEAGGYLRVSILGNTNDTTPITQGIAYGPTKLARVELPIPVSYIEATDPDTIGAIEDIGFVTDGPYATHIFGTGAGIGGATGEFARHARAASKEFRRLDGEAQFDDIRNFAIIEGLTAKALSQGMQPRHTIKLVLLPDLIVDFWTLCFPGQFIYIKHDLKGHKINSLHRVESMPFSADLAGNSRCEVIVKQWYDPYGSDNIGYNDI